MPGKLDAFLNVAIPIGIFLFFGFKIYQSCQDPFDRFFGWIRDSISPKEDEEEGAIYGMNYELQFK